jgi:hypothetical protein
MVVGPLALTIDHWQRNIPRDKPEAESQQYLQDLENQFYIDGCVILRTVAETADDFSAEKMVRDH